MTTAKSLCLLFSCLVAASSANHYRGGATHWRVDEIIDDNTVLLKSTMRMITNNEGTESCPYLFGASLCYHDFQGAETLKNINKNGQYYCTDECAEDGWKTTQVVDYTVQSTNGACVSSHKGAEWMNGLQANWYTGPPHAYSMPMKIDLRVNSNGKINSSPVAIMQPVVKFMSGCPHAIQIPVFDEESHFVTCRSANFSPLDDTEGGSVGSLDEYDYLSISSDCILTFEGRSTQINLQVPVALIVEDRENAGSAVLSQSSLQFLVQVIPQSAISSPVYTCVMRPTFQLPTPPDGQIIIQQVGNRLRKTLRAKPAFEESQIDHFGIIGPNKVAKSAIAPSTEGEYECTIAWTPTEQDVGPNHFCYEARESNGLLSHQRCFTVDVTNESPCASDQGGCSDKCVLDAEGYHCECDNPCWELAEDQRQCIPKMVRICGRKGIQITVEECAVYDGRIGVGDYDKSNPGQPPSNANCANKGNNTHYYFEFGLDECETKKLETVDELKYKGSITVYKDEGSNDVILRGIWVEVLFICTVEKYFNVSGSFDPEDESITVIVEEGFGEIQVSFDFYEDDTFEKAYLPEHYPVTYRIADNDPVYFGIYAESVDDDVELYTDSCVAFPYPAVEGVSHTIIKDGCLEDLTAVAYDHESPLRNNYGFETFRFKDSIDGIYQDTDVVIECRSVVCVMGLAGTTCSQTTCDSSRRKHILTKSHFIKRKSTSYIEEILTDESEESPTRDPSITETNSYDLNPSPVVSFVEPETSSQGPDTSTQSDHATIHLLNGFLLWCSVLVAVMV